MKKLDSFTDEEIDWYLDVYLLYSKKKWLLLLEEKLRRVELEIAVV